MGQVKYLRENERDEKFSKFRGRYRIDQPFENLINLVLMKLNNHKTTFHTSHQFLIHEVFHQILSFNVHNVPKIISCGVVEIVV